MKIILKDGTVKEFNESKTLFDIAKSLSTSLAKKSWAGVVDGVIKPLDKIIDFDANVEFIDKDAKEAFNIINYTTSVALSYVMHKYNNSVKIVDTNYDEDGFYVDFVSDVNFKKSDLIILKKELQKLIKANLPISRTCFSIKEAKNIFKDNQFALDKINNLPSGKKDKCTYLVNNSFYVYNSFVAINPSNIKAFDIFNVSGVFVNDEYKDYTVQRIRGLSGVSEKQFNTKLEEIEERKERDHRKIGQDLEIFTFDNLIGAGLPIWLPNGTIIKRQIQNYLRKKEFEYDFVEVETPILGSVDLYKKSGHWQHYKDSMFAPIIQEHDSFILRPMACPHHIQIFNSSLRSYRELPLRISEHAVLHRYESSGSLTGLERVRMMELTDSHIFAREDQVESEFTRAYNLIKEVLDKFNIKIDYFSLSLRDKTNKEKYYDNDAMWDKAEKMLENVLIKLNVPYKKCVGEAAFYGPKLDVQIKTALNHEITVSTLQFDLLLPDKFDLWYVDENNEKVRPIMIHRGLIGTYERFISIYLEQTKGVFPFWISPTQIKIIPVSINSDIQMKAVNELQKILKKNMYRTSLDVRDQRLAYKIREAQTKKIPIQIIIGDDESDLKNVTFREYGKEQDQKMSLAKFLDFIEKINK